MSTSHKPNRDNAVATSRKYLEFIKSETLTREQGEELTRLTVNNFANHYNPGFLEYRKSVTEGGDFAAVEWSGHGATFIDALGRSYIDCLGGYGLLSLGWSHQKVIAAVKAQIERAPMPTQELLDPPRGMLAHLLSQITPGDLQYAFFVSSGTESVEGAMKFAKAATGKSGFIAAVRGFHGKTAGSLSLMGKAKFRKPAMPLLPNVFHVPFGDADAVEQQLRIAREVGNDIAAVVMEPVQGEAGAIVPPDDFWPRLRKLCDEYEVLLIADEVQTGLGRTGALWGVNHWNVAPDIICSAKALGGGVMPIGAFIASAKVWQPFIDDPFFHTTTTGGNPIACAAAIATINVVLEEDLPRQAAEKGVYFMERLQPLAAKYDGIYQKITGKGLLIGQHFHDSHVGYQVAAGLFRRGVLISGTLTNAQTIRIEPPLVIEYDEIDEMLNRLEDTLKAVSGAPASGDVLTFPAAAPDVVKATHKVAAANTGSTALAGTEVATA
ncbi:MAG TPA: putrescine aminotransferase [Ktedonobacterales bacterium]|nr:putrescine aminotransferase [Ktedonobacterales bacterium]